MDGIHCASHVSVFSQGGRSRPVAVNPHDREKAVRLARLGPGEQPRANQGSQYCAARAGFRPISSSWRVP